LTVTYYFDSGGPPGVVGNPLSLLTGSPVRSIIVDFRSQGQASRYFPAVLTTPFQWKGLHFQERHIVCVIPSDPFLNFHFPKMITFLDTLASITKKDIIPLSEKQKSILHSIVSESNIKFTPKYSSIK